MVHFNKPQYRTIVPKKKDIPKGVWVKCPLSGEIVFNKDLVANQMVVPKSGYHFRIGARERLKHLIDPGTFQEFGAAVRAADPLSFVDSQPYPDRLKKYEKDSSLTEAVVCGWGMIHGIPVSIAVMDFRFCGGSMGSGTGEKITRAIEMALNQKIPCIIISAAGGARMQEGIFSLMQMAKTSAALGRLAAARIPFISVLTDPTTGGVTASFATLGDVILAEPGALIGFAGAVVIKETTKQLLPAGFQRAEFLLKHGLIDQIVSRLEMRDRLRDVLQALYVRGKPPVAKEA
jgi:acetyl-CoA carboxylase carboxyl transferase subunit beta